MADNHLTIQERARARQLRNEGKTLKEVAREIGCAHMSIWQVDRRLGVGEQGQLSWSAGPRRLSLAEREEISRGLLRGDSFAAIGRQLGRSTSTVSREVAANGGLTRYRAWRAHSRAYHQARRPKVAKFSACPRLTEVVSEWLKEFWSPQEIARRLPKEFPDDPMMRVSHETIYQSLYVQGRGELRRELARCLRSGRAKRKAQGRIETRGRIKNMVMISERPAEVADRAVPGHWEGDLLVGEAGKSHIATLVERSTRYVMLAKVPNAKAETVTAALSELVERLPAQLWRSLTWDQGHELAAHEFFSMTTGIPVYFCDPHSPWQRGANENTNGLLRQYFPKGTSLRRHSQEDLDKVAISLNGRPRETLGWDTPAERLNALLVADTT